MHVQHRSKWKPHGKTFLSFYLDVTDVYLPLEKANNMPIMPFIAIKARSVNI